MAGRYSAYTKALVAQGKSSEAEQIYREWQTAWTYADVELTASHL